MSDPKSKKSPYEAERAARQAAALRENLKRRKQQARERAAAPRDGAVDLQARAAALRDFWFGIAGGPEYGRPRKIWFEKNAEFDEELCRRFLADHERAASGACDPLAETPEGAVALVLLLDQLPRNLFRCTPRAFATDAQARAVAKRAVDAGFDRQVPPVERVFLYLPFEHSESLEDQRRSLALFESLPVTPEFPASDRDLTIAYARRHLEIIERFGRFPHRNAALGRASTPEELAFLQEPNSSF
ncbi:MAG TPA: DUF924 family protein [Alphaproteobacteria bacterium]|nr:DUF924 family protein [Alphaproteobacteria bacterium]